MTGTMDVDETSAELVAEAEEKIDTRIEPLLTCALCMAFPTNLARRLRMSSPMCKTRTVKSAMISPGSVNGMLPSQRPDRGGKNSDGTTWWLYSDSLSTNDKFYLQATTRIQDWHVAVFGGLKVKDIVTESDSVTELDSWISVKAGNARATGLLRSVRRELQDTLSWQALASLRGGAGAAASFLERGTALVRGAVGVLAGGKLDKASAQFVQKWTAPAIEEAVEQSDRAEDDGAAADPPAKRSQAPKKKAAGVAKRPKAASASATQKRGAASSARVEKDEAVAEREEEPAEEEAGKDTDSMIADLESKTVADLKEILKSKGLKVGGRKAELVERCAQALAQA
mmetsp:Transcript_127295/g.396186  ORF Transcript_127295/g.396186 Transcript_127295/m.396186 type:complete len:342 (+) Transcript_127295:490-1515(+)